MQLSAMTISGNAAAPGRRNAFRRIVAGIALAACSFGFAQNTITVAVGSGPAGFDPQNNNSSATSGIYINLFEYLIFKDVNGDFQPALATAWEAVDDHTWRIELREGVTWHDGEPFTAEDVKFTFERVAGDPLLVRHAYYRHIEEVEIVNDYEVLIHTSRPDPIMPSNLARNGASVIPQHYYEEVGVDVASRTPIGTGPYRFVEYRTDDRLILEAYDGYWGGQPAYDQAVFRMIPEGSTAVSELLTGGVDIVSSVRITELPRVENSDAARIVPVNGNTVFMISFDTSPDVPTGDVRVRKAVDLAIDNELYAEVLQGGYGVPVLGRVSPSTTASPQELYDTYNYDVEAARELLAEAGYGPGELTLVFQGTTGFVDYFDLAGAMLEDAGINVEIELYEGSVWVAMRDSGFSHMNISGVSDSSFDYGNTLIDLTCGDGEFSERTRWCNEEYTDLVTRANAEFDPEVRYDLLRQATAILEEELPLSYLYNSTSFAGVSSDVNYTPRADSLIVLFETTPAD